MSLLNCFVDGQWLGTDEITKVYSPGDMELVVATCRTASIDQVDDAVVAARHALQASRHQSTQSRADSLEFVASELLMRKEELGELLTREEGKTLAEGIGEVARAAYVFRFFANEAIRMTGELGASVRPGVRVEVYREPVGVVGIITPWNFPIAIPAWKIAPALAYGNSVVIKPAELAPASAHALTEIISRAGFPDGTFNLVMGPGSRVGQHLIDHPGIDAISFTGSQYIGTQIAKSCSARGARFQLEMGGKNPLLILRDADLDVAVDAAVNAAFLSTGQRCTAASRLIVERDVHDEFVSKVCDKLQGLTVGDPLNLATHIGPVIDQKQFEKNLDYIDIGQREGCDLEFGGHRVEELQKGFFQVPALLTNASNSMRVCQEEIFGPVAAVIVVDSYDEALTLANDTPFGLSAGICTRSHKLAQDFKLNSKSGLVMVNLPTAGLDYHVPFGGVAGSSVGAREQGSYAREFYTITKTAYDFAV